MSEDIKIDLVNYITGQIDPQHKAGIEQWISEDPAHQQLYLELQEAWHAALFAGSTAALHPEEAYRQLSERLGISAPARPKKGYIRLLVAASAAAALLIISLTAYRLYRGGKTENPAFNQSIYVPVAGKKKLLLKDGTTVWLNSGSVLQLSKGFGIDNRTVFLEGEGYFEVTTDKKRVFTVKTRDYTIRDIGTIFNIKTYTADTKFEAAVMEGEISIEGKFSRADKTSKIFLARNGVLKINRNGMLPDKPAVSSAYIDTTAVRIVKATNIEDYAGWKDNLLVFDDDSFRDIANKLQRKYNVVIRIEDERLAGYRYSGSFNDVPAIQNILDILKETTPMSYTMKGDTITIRSKP